MEIDHKVAGGKLLRISVEVVDNVIMSFSLTGDFFLHPEDAVVMIEKALIGVAVDDVAQKLEKLFADEGITAIGFVPKDVQEGIGKVE